MIAGDVEAKPYGGFSFVEFLIILSAAIIVLSSVDSWLGNFKTRSRVAEALYVAETVRTNIVITCAADPAVRQLSNESIVHDLPDSPYVHTITVGGNCKLAEITLLTKNTGLIVDPTLTITGNMASDAVVWRCSGSGLDVDLPRRCREG